MKKGKRFSKWGLRRKGERNPKKTPTHARSSEREKQRNEGGERECKENKQAQAVISVQKLKGRAIEGEKSYLLSIWLHEDWKCEGENEDCRESLGR